MILKGVFDVFVLAETKIDGAFPSSQFCIQGYKMFCKDRNRFGGSLIVYIRRGLITRRINHLEGNYIDRIYCSASTAWEVIKMDTVSVHI